MIDWLFSLLVWLTSSADAAALRRTAPGLTPTAAAENIAAARLAGSAYRLDPDLLLAIAWRESKYERDAVGPTVRGKRACGVMEPVMRTVCDAPTLLDGYLEGARHLREWMRATHSQLEALIGYAGGYAMIERCRVGPIERERGGRTVDLCSAPERIRAAWIHLERKRSSTSPWRLW